MPFVVITNQRQCLVPLYQSFSDKALIRILSIWILFKLFQPSPADEFRRLGRFGLIYLELSSHFSWIITRISDYAGISSEDYLHIFHFLYKYSTSGSLLKERENFRRGRCCRNLRTIPRGEDDPFFRSSSFDLPPASSILHPSREDDPQPTRGRSGFILLRPQHPS